jgi:hypothetical protein
MITKMHLHKHPHGRRAWSLVRRNDRPGNCPSHIRHLTDVSAHPPEKTGYCQKKLPDDRFVGVNVVAAEDWHDELVLVAEMSSVNNQIARFVLRMLDSDARRNEQIAVADECRLGGRLVNLGYALQDRAVHRAAGRHRDGRAISAAPCNNGRTR